LNLNQIHRHLMGKGMGILQKDAELTLYIMMKILIKRRTVNL